MAMSNQTELSELATQKLQNIHQLVLQFQALESDLRDTFTEIERNHQTETKALRRELNQLKGIEDKEINTNKFYGASQLKQNPLAHQQQQQQQQQQQLPQTRVPNGSLSFQPQQPPVPQQSPSYRNSNAPYMQQHNSNNNGYQPHNHWKSTTPMSYQQNQHNYAQQPAYNQSNAYHAKQARSQGIQGQHQQNGYNQQMMNQQYSQQRMNPNAQQQDDSKQQLPPQQKQQKQQQQQRQRPKNPVANIVSKFTQNKNETENTLTGLSNGISERDFYKKYWIEAGKIGEGAFARVRKITRKSDKAVFALKMIKKKGKSSEDIAALQREILVLQKCDHENIVRLGDWCDTKKRIYMVVEFCDGGDVFERVVQYKKFSEKSAIHVVHQVASGIGHVHAQNFVHRDLKPDNLMYLTKAVDSPIKIIDFGLAGDCNENPCKTPCGTAHYAAPEVLSSLEYDQSADMWSLGVIIYTLLCGFPPFFDASNNMKNLYHLIKKGQYSFPSPFWDDISENAKDLISKLLVKDPKERLNAAQVLKHVWVANADKAPDEDLGNNYVEQMTHWQSTRQETEFGLGTEAPPPPPPGQAIALYANASNPQQQHEVH